MRVTFAATGENQPVGGAARTRSASAGRAQALLRFPDDLLARHRAAVLSPQTAVLLPGQERPMSTVYRLDVLLVPEDLWNPGELHALNEALRPIGLYLTVPGPAPTATSVPSELDLRPTTPRVRPVRIRVRPGAAPTAIDAWVALQTLRAAAVSGGRGDAGPGSERPDPAAVARISLDHLLVGGAFVASIAMFGEGNMPTEGSGVDSITTYGQIGYGGLTPVALSPYPPARHKVPEGARRPVVVVIDSGIATHPWFEQGNLSVRLTVQAAVIGESMSAASPGEPVISTEHDGPVIDDPLVGTLASHFGHGTFIAGLIRQIGPDADIEAIRVMHSDGIAYESDVLCALATLADEVAAWRGGDDDIAPVDIVSLSLGYFDESPDADSAAIRHAIGRLTKLGVTVVAAAGNFATRRPFLPAALARHFDNDPTRAPMLSVGALNPNGTVALFSDDGNWVTCFATGVSLISAYPVIAQGSTSAASRLPGLHRESLDTDDFTGGFAMWSGTSFAVPVVVGQLTDALTPPASLQPAQEAVAAARTALATVISAAK